MKAHRTDGVSLSFGLIFLAVVGWWLAAQVVTVRLPALGWFAAVGLIVVGGIGLLGALRSGKPGTDLGTGTGTGTDLGTADADITRELPDDPDRAGIEPVTGAPCSPARPPHGPA
ncbi:MAG TPA: hypothetical protein VF755_26980 [Catenuloplanes sp.]|jgi:hypothetical protein